MRRACRASRRRAGSSLVTPGGRAGLQPYTFTFDPNGVLQPCFTGQRCDLLAARPRSAATGELLRRTARLSRPSTGVGPNGFNRQQYRTLAVPVERYIFAARGTFEITHDDQRDRRGDLRQDQLVARDRAVPARTRTRFSPTRRAPIDTLIGGVVRPNPFVPAAISAVATDTDGDGLRDSASPGGLTGSEPATRRALAISIASSPGLKARSSTIASTGTSATTTARPASSRPRTVSPTSLNFRSALSAVVDITDLDGDGNSTEIICADATARAQGCVPINIFGFGSISPEAAAFVSPPSRRCRPRSRSRSGRPTCLARWSSFRPARLGSRSAPNIARKPALRITTR